MYRERGQASPSNRHRRTRAVDIEDATGELYSWRSAKTKPRPISQREQRDAVLRLDARKSIREIIAAAKRAGTHSDQFTTMCDGCRNWTSSIYYIVPGSHRRLCADCADAMGQGPQSIAAFNKKQGVPHVS